MKPTFKQYLGEMTVPQMFHTFDDETIQWMIVNDSWNGHGSSISDWTQAMMDESNKIGEMIRDAYDAVTRRSPNLVGQELDNAVDYSPEFFEALKTWVNKHRIPFVIRNIQDELADVQEGATLTLYRNIHLSDDDIEALVAGRKTDLGIYWSTTPVDGYWGKGGTPVYCVAEVPMSAINWKATIMSRIDYLWGDDETEIQLTKGARIKLVRVEDEHGEVLGEPNSDCTV